MPLQLPRRTLLKAATAGTIAVASAANSAPTAVGKPRIAAVFTEFRHRSHAYNFLMNLMGRYVFNGQPVESGVEIVSFYADQFPPGDMARETASRFNIPLYPTIADALCAGSNELAVDGVLLIGEHGNYPVNERGQRMYPRKEFFDQIVAVMRRSKRIVPIFNDKHLSYRWDWAKAMYDEAHELGIPLMAGSSVPLAQRVPEMALPAGAKVEEAVSIHGGGIESYDFHALEVMQSFVESPGREAKRGSRGWSC